MITFRYFDYENSKELQREDLELCRRYNRENDEDSFIALKNKYTNLMESAIKDVESRFTENIGCYIDHEDLVQEADIALLKCITRYGVYKNIKEFPFILYTHVYIACNNYFGDILSLNFITCDRGICVQEIYGDPYIYIEYKEDINTILNIMEREVSTKAKDMVVRYYGLNYTNKLTLKEIGEMYNVSATTVRNYIIESCIKARHYIALSNRLYHKN